MKNDYLGLKSLCSSKLNQIPSSGKAVVEGSGVSGVTSRTVSSFSEVGIWAVGSAADLFA